jgi:hypothetical protein
MPFSWQKIDQGDLASSILMSRIHTCRVAVRLRNGEISCDSGGFAHHLEVVGVTSKYAQAKAEGLH